MSKKLLVFMIASIFGATSVGARMSYKDMLALSTTNEAENQQSNQQEKQPKKPTRSFKAAKFVKLDQATKIAQKRAKYPAVSYKYKKGDTVGFIYPVKITGDPAQTLKTKKDVFPACVQTESGLSYTIKLPEHKIVEGVPTRGSTVMAILEGKIEEKKNAENESYWISLKKHASSRLGVEDAHIKKQAKVSFFKRKAKGVTHA